MPITTKTAMATVSSTAQTHSLRVTLRCASRALSGSANSSEDTRTGCTSSNDPLLSANACNT